MTRPAVRHMLFAFAAVAAVSAVGSNPALSDQQGTILSHNLKSSQAVINGPSQPGAPKGLATKPAQQTTTTHYPLRWWQDYSAGSRTRNIGQYFRNAHGSLD